MGRTLRAGTGAGANPTSFDAVKSIYDKQGRLRKTTNPYSTSGVNGDTPGLPNPTINDYDALSRVWKVTLPDSKTLVAQYSGAVMTVTDEVGRRRRNESDGFGRLVKVAEQNTANGNLEWETTYAYDLLNNLVQGNQGGQTRAFKYDALSRMTFERTPEQNATIDDGTGTFWSAKYSYTNFNALLTREDARRVITTYGYDGLNRLTSVSYDTSTAQGVEPTTPVGINYNNPSGQVAANGTISYMTDSAGREDYAYDGLGRTSSKTRQVDSNSYTTSYEYNQISQLAVIVYPSGKRMRMNHDSRGRMSGIDKVNTSGSVLATYISNIGYNASGQISGQTIGNVVTESFGYNNRLQLSSQTATKVGGPTNGLMNLAYNYDAQQDQSGVGTTAGNSGQLMGITGTINGVARGQNFTYDNVGRLKTSTASWAGGQASYTYDRWGNRTAMSGAQSQTVAMQQMAGAPAGVTNNRIAAVGGVSYEYDAAGNLTSDNGISNRYRYDGESRLVKADGASVVYTYDAANRRVKKVASGVTTIFVWQGSKVIAEYSTGQTTSNGLRHYLADRLSTRGTVDDQGIVKGTQDHYPFGEDAGATNEVEKHRFTNYERDGEIGSDYAVNRQYSNVTGRFMRPDPVRGSIGDPQSLNRYSYSRNDPANLVDPLGLMKCDATSRSCGRPGGFWPSDSDWWGDRILDLPGFGTYWGSINGYFEKRWTEYLYDHVFETGVLPVGQTEINVCLAMADLAQKLANEAIRKHGAAYIPGAVQTFDRAFSQAYMSNDGLGPNIFTAYDFSTKNPRPSPGVKWGMTGFKSEFYEPDGGDQTHHFAAFLSAGINDQAAAAWLHEKLTDSNNPPDIALGRAAYAIGEGLRKDYTNLYVIGRNIREKICDTK